MRKTRVSVYLHDWQIEKLNEMNANLLDVKRMTGLPLSHFIRNLVTEVLQKEMR